MWQVEVEVQWVTTAQLPLPEVLEWLAIVLLEVVAAEAVEQP